MLNFNLLPLSFSLAVSQAAKEKCSSAVSQIAGTGDGVSPPTQLNGGRGGAQGPGPAAEGAGPSLPCPTAWLSDGLWGITLLGSCPFVLNLIFPYDAKLQVIWKFQKKETEIPF